MEISFWPILMASPFIGSWLGVLVRRWPAGRPVIVGRSQCDACGQPLGLLDLVPVVSFIALRGRCRQCGAKIGWFPLAIELAALAVAGIALLTTDNAAQAWIDAALGWALLLAAWIDAETFRLPDFVTLPLILAGLAVSWRFHPETLYDHAAAAALGYLGFRLLNQAYRTLRHRDGLGAGDAKLLGAAGAWLGAAALPEVILIAAVLGLLATVIRHGGLRTMRAQQAMPFGPALAAAFFCLRLAAH